LVFSLQTQQRLKNSAEQRKASRFAAQDFLSQRLTETDPVQAARVPSPFSIPKQANPVRPRPTRTTASKIAVICPCVHEQAIGFALFRATLNLAMSLRSEAASQRERSRRLVRLGLP
jgi:hypothetical protein